MRKPTDAARIVVTTDGPYLVNGALPLARQTVVTSPAGEAETWQEGVAIATRDGDEYALCRCGQSSTKPFCDGTHEGVAFDGTETADRSSYARQAKVYNGAALKLLDAESLCATGRFCDTHGKVWNEIAHTEQPAVSATLIRQVGQCPSGRLVVIDKTTNKAVEPSYPVSIGLVDDPSEACAGPLWLRGGIPVVAADGYHYEVRQRVALCRCGASANKPFCDGSHIKTRFRE